ncbi:MAG: flagellar hook-length control protein FliK [Oscillospiraceae bacterium]
MTVAMNSNGSYRADFMLSDAATTQRANQTAAKQDDGFAKLLDSRSGNQEKPTGSVNSSETVSTVSTYQSTEPKAEPERVCEVPDKESLLVKPSEEPTFSGVDEAVIPEDTMELAKQIVSGEIKLEDIPIDRLTFELLKAIIVVKKQEVSKDDKEERDERANLFEPTMQFSMQSNAAMALEQQIFLEISLIVEADSEQSLLAKLDAIGETMESAPENSLPLIENTFADNTRFVDNEQAAEQSAEVSKESAKPAEVKPADSASESPEPKGEVVVRKIIRPEQKDFSQQESAEQNSSGKQQTSISKEISEELEMLKSAKLNSKAKTDVVQTEEAAQNEKSAKTDAAEPVRTTNPLNADSPIVLVGRDGEMIEVRPSEIVSQVAKLVQQAVSENREATEYSMVLNPEELGRITVKLVKAADGAVSVTIVAENASTQRMLEQNGELMQSNLRANGVQLQSWQTVNEAHQETMQREYDGSSKNPYYREEGENSDDEQSEGESFADIIAAM